MPTPSAVLQNSLEQHNATFESLLRLIPAKYYLVREEPEEQVREYFTRKTVKFTSISRSLQAASKYQKHKKKTKAPKQAIKEASKKAKHEKVYCFRPSNCICS
jgi:hypothetical protein